MRGQVTTLLRTLIFFFSGSVLGSVIDYLTTLALNYYFSMPPVLALAVTMTVSASMVFLFHDFITFSRPSHDRSRRYFAFLLLAVIIFLIRSSVLMLLMRVGVPLALALFVAIGFAAIVNFIVSKKRIFV